MDFGAILSSPTRDPDWIKKCALIGVMLIVPIAGALNMLGWMKANYARAKAGDPTLAEPGFNYIGSGWELFLAILPAVLVILVWNVGVGIVAGVLHSRGLAMLGNLVGMLLNLAIQLVVSPALVYRHVVHGKGFGDAFDVGDVMRVVTTNIGLFATFAVINFLAGLLGGVGLLACCVGALVTVPAASVIQANALQSFEQASGL